MKKYKVKIKSDYGYIEGNIELTEEEVKMVKTGALSIINNDNKLQLAFDNDNIENIDLLLFLYFKR